MIYLNIKQESVEKGNWKAYNKSNLMIYKRMVNILKTNKEIYLDFIGNTPSKIETFKTTEEMIDYFLCFFEISWTNPILSESKNVRNYLLKKYEQLIKDYELNSDDMNKKWWLFVLITLEKFSIESDLFYANDVINLIYCNFNSISLKELKDYVNTVNYAIYNNVGESMSLRPSTMLSVDAFVDDSDFLLEDLIKNQEFFIKRFSRYIRQKDMNKAMLESVFIYSIKNKKHFNHWVCLFDAFVAFFISMSYDLDGEFKSITDQKFIILRDQVLNIVSGFFKTFIEDSEVAIKISNIVFNKVIELIYEKYNLSKINI